MEGLTALALDQAVLSVAGWNPSLPRAVDAGVVERLLAGCDRRRAIDRRDYAILMLLGRLGLRAGEVVALRLEDIDWRAGEILVRGKRRRQDRLPLPVDVGEALAAYLHRGRPRVPIVGSSFATSRPMSAWRAAARSTGSWTGRAGGREWRISIPTGFATLWPPSCSAVAPAWRRSGASCAKAARRPLPLTRRSTSTISAWSASNGRRSQS